MDTNQGENEREKSSLIQSKTVQGNKNVIGAMNRWWIEEKERKQKEKKNRKGKKMQKKDQ